LSELHNQLETGCRSDVSSKAEAFSLRAMKPYSEPFVGTHGKAKSSISAL